MAVSGASADLLPVRSARFEHRQLSLDRVPCPDGDMSGSQTGDEPVSPLACHTHGHHHLRHFHSIYSRKSAFLAERLSADVAGPRPASCSCALLAPAGHDAGVWSPGRRTSGLPSPSPSPAAASGLSEESPDAADRTDSLPLDMSFTWFDMLALITSISTFLIDIGTDAVVAAFHLHNGDYWYFSLTLAFIAIPTLIVTGISLRWYVLDAREQASPPVSRCKWATRVTFLLLQLGPIVRYVDSLVYGIQFRRSSRDRAQQVKYFQYMVYEGEHYCGRCFSIPPQLLSFALGFVLTFFAIRYGCNDAQAV